MCAHFHINPYVFSIGFAVGFIGGRWLLKYLSSMHRERTQRRWLRAAGINPDLK